MESSSTEKRKRFKRLAESRVNKALDAIRKLGNLSNRRVYDFEDAEAKKIIRALRDSVSEVEDKLLAPANRQERRFTL